MASPSARLARQPKFSTWYSATLLSVSMGKEGPAEAPDASPSLKLLSLYFVYDPAVGTQEFL